MKSFSKEIIKRRLSRQKSFYLLDNFIQLKKIVRKLLYVSNMFPHVAALDIILR